MVRYIYSEFWNGMIKVNVVSSIKEVPGKARYVYSDYEEHLDIYDFEDMVFGVII